MKLTYHFCLSHILQKGLTYNLSIYLTWDTSWRMNTTEILDVFYAFFFFFF